MKKVILIGIMAILCWGCNNPKTDITKETTDVEVSGSMESVFIDSRYVSGDRIDEFIEDKTVKELVVTNKFSKNEDLEDEAIKYTIQREDKKYVLDGKAYNYFYKETYNAGKSILEDYILSDIILDKDAYIDYHFSSMHREGDPVVVATNIIDAK